jgi:hypothetical protein
MVNRLFWKYLSVDVAHPPAARPSGWRHAQRIRQTVGQLVPGTKLIVEMRLESEAEDARESVTLAVARPFDEVETIDMIAAELVEFFRRLEAEGKL